MDLFQGDLSCVDPNSSAETTGVSEDEAGVIPSRSHEVEDQFDPRG